MAVICGNIIQIRVKSNNHNCGHGRELKMIEDGSCDVVVHTFRVSPTTCLQTADQDDRARDFIFFKQVLRDFLSQVFNQQPN